MQLTAFAAALSTRKHYVVYRLVLRDNGKTDKIPVNHLTGENADAQDPANWLYAHEAEFWAAMFGPGYGVGVVIYPGCGIAVVDFDHCRLESGGWMPHVAAFLAKFPDGLTETSVSTMGRHLFLRVSKTPEHGTRNSLYCMECYTSKRFIAITGNEWAGSLVTDYTVQFAAFVAQFFPPKGEDDENVSWSDRPVSAWRGPVDDNELVSLAHRTRGVKSFFGGAAFADLWSANADVLSRAFPSQNSHSAWDGSAVDQAFANHLAFWTGSDCARMERIMMASPLRRPKWDRTKYLHDTILNACASQKEWYCSASGAAPDAPPVSTINEAAPLTTPNAAASNLVPPPPMVSDVMLPTGVAPPGAIVVPKVQFAPGEVPAPGYLVSFEPMRQIFKDYCYIESIDAIQNHKGHTATKTRFEAMHAGPKWTLTADGQPAKSAWDAYLNNEVHSFPRVQTQCFLPLEPLGLIREYEGRHEINCYVPANIERQKGDPSPFLELVGKMLPIDRDAEILISFMAAAIRYLGVKFTWTVFLQGAKGNGKTTIAKIMEYCISHKYTHWAKADQLGEKFNDAYSNKLFLIIDEMYSDDTRELQELLKQLVTADRIEVRPMYGEKCMKQVCYNLMLISNHQNGVRIDTDERRYAPLFCAQQSKADVRASGLDSAYFRRIRAWLTAGGYAIVYDYLMDFHIAPEFDPTVDCFVAPETSSTELAMTASLGGVEQEVLEAISQGHEGFRNGWISSTSLDITLERIGKGRAIPRNARRGLVQSLGYITHPALTEGGLCPIAMPDGQTARLYILKGHPWAVPHLSVDQVRAGFLEAQKKK